MKRAFLALTALTFASCGFDELEQEACARLGFCDGGTENSDSGTMLDAGATDAGSTDAGTVDSGTADAGTLDGGTLDAGMTDAGFIDAGVVDGGSLDSGIPDSGVIDSGVADSGIPDSGMSTDAGAADASVVIDAGSRDSGVLPFPITQVLMALTYDNKESLSGTTNFIAREVVVDAVTQRVYAAGDRLGGSPIAGPPVDAWHHAVWGPGAMSPEPYDDLSATYRPTLGSAALYGGFISHDDAQNFAVMTGPTTTIGRPTANNSVKIALQVGATEIITQNSPLSTAPFPRNAIHITNGWHTDIGADSYVGFSGSSRGYFDTTFFGTKLDATEAVSHGFVAVIRASGSIGAVSHVRQLVCVTGDDLFIRRTLVRDNSLYIVLSTLCPNMHVYDHTSTGGMNTLNLQLNPSMVATPHTYLVRLNVTPTAGNDWVADLGVAGADEVGMDVEVTQGWVATTESNTASIQRFNPVTGARIGSLLNFSAPNFKFTGLAIGATSVYAVGTAASTFFINSSSFPVQGPSDGVLMKLDKTTGAVSGVGVIGGNGVESFGGIAITVENGTENIWVAGATESVYTVPTVLGGVQMTEQFDTQSRRMVRGVLWRFQ